ncbi:hypothetical protein Poli38472_003822 [Pythium oligandrum]|uniref:Cytochrome P450 n=1 Tax=Pythium oligandrum TaxID=41045 RepID=A0A8K1CP70_PYTOL|nr:hypothetical protein Poli38472_003822 [Pythium oligandrum]|eukprot:TMW66057.1 hypothetical protein Poli38472_003822 [Pythium oligandrum]
MDPLIGFEDPKIPVFVGTTLVVVGLAVYALRQPKEKPQYRKLEQPDTALPILGNLLDVARRVDNFHDWILENTVRFEGRPWKFSLPGDGDIIIVTSPEAVEEVLSTQFTKFIKGRLQNEVLGGIAPDTVVTSDGERWYHQRKTTVKFFSARVLDLFVQRSIQKNILRIHSLMEDAMRNQTTVDLKSIGSTIKHPIHEAMELSSLAVYYRARRPEWWWELGKFLNVGWEAKLKSSVDALYACIHEILKESVDRMVQKKQSGEDTTDQTCKSIVELFLESPQAGADGLTQDDFVGFVTALLFASRDTTADTLIWVFHLLHKHPEAEKKLREEMDRELAAFPRDNASCLNMEQLKPLVYLEAVIKETLRLWEQ